DEEALVTPTSTVPPRGTGAAGVDPQIPPQPNPPAVAGSGHHRSHHHRASAAAASVPQRSTSGGSHHSRSSNLYNTRKHAKAKDSEKTRSPAAAPTPASVDEDMRAILENEIAEQAAAASGTGGG